MDVLDEFERRPTLEMIEATLDFVLQTNYDGVEWERAIAAAELVAVINRNPAAKRSTTHEKVIQLVKRSALASTPSLVEKAMRVCDRALSDAEIKDRIATYSRPEDYAAWTLAVSDLRKRLQESQNA